MCKSYTDKRTLHKWIFAKLQPESAALNPRKALSVWSRPVIAAIRSASWKGVHAIDPREKEAVLEAIDKWEEISEITSAEWPG